MKNLLSWFYLIFSGACLAINVGGRGFLAVYGHSTTAEALVNTSYALFWIVTTPIVFVFAVIGITRVLSSPSPDSFFEGEK